jgi:ParB-like chromosome segregation protein Spo0J
VVLPVSGLRALRLSVGRDDAALRLSISEVGLVRPLLLARGLDGRPVVVSGGRRLSALRALGAETVPCLAPDGPHVAAAAVSENLERGLSPAELALAWDLARKAIDPAEREKIMRLLGISPGDKRLPALAAAAAASPAAQEALAAGRLDLENAEALAPLPPEERERALELILAAGASRQNRRRWIEWLLDLRRIEKRPLGAIIGQGLMEAAAGPDGAKAVSERLQRLRAPGVAALRDERRELLKSLRLPGGLALWLDPELEDAAGDLRISFQTPEELGRLAQEAGKLAKSEVFGQLWRGPGGWPPTPPKPPSPANPRTPPPSGRPGRKPS